MKSRVFFEVHVGIGGEWKLSASFETEAEARRYAHEMRKKVSYRIIRDRYDGEAEKFKGRRIIVEKLFEETNSVAGSLAARAKAQEKLLEGRQARISGISASGSAAPEEEERSIFERFVETMKDEAAKKNG